MRRQPWVMSEADTFDLLNAIDERLATPALHQHQRDVLVRLRTILEDDIAVVEAAIAMRAASDGPCAETCTA
ncbi:hypothetical protein [Methylobacterium sp. PvR107]|uniref:hypothetical protein n=1 Tax=Methylobacterium sp. PvR107 TaxID=2806597 RepID=UPI001AE8308A|nr:hypothetical protein [Methylobacterium sp. PvR107]MBP1180930.1 hypothetical protein [Methylobacterium sp. PvR107]